MPAKASSILAAKSLGALNASVIAMNKEEAARLADQIYTKFTPFAWHCSCAGRHPDCAGVKNDETEQILHYQMQRIRKYVEGLGNDN